LSIWNGRLTVTNVIDWLKVTGRYMVDNHPELYQDVPEAIEALSNTLETLRDTGWEQATILFGPYLMYRVEEDGVEEVFMTQKLSSLAIFAPEGICRAYGWVEEIELDDPLDDSLDME
jgi:hypothetical protein